MRISALLLAPVALLGLSITAQAADITYNVVGGTLASSTSTGSFSGSFSINSSTEFIDGGTFSVVAPTGGTTYNFTSTSTGPIPGSETFSDGLGDTFRFNINGPIGSLGINTLALFGAGGDTFFSNAAGLRLDRKSVV
jgi:hypothetical protein